MRVLKRFVVGVFALTSAMVCQPGFGQQPDTHHPWQETLRRELPLLGHRNWILIVDSAYPLQTSPGVETVETKSDQVEVVRDVLKELAGSIQVRPVVYMDAELPFINESDASGVSKYKRQIAAVLGRLPVTELPHEQIISKIDEAGKTFHVLVLKTNLAVPYTSVFLQLNCKYWGDAAEASLRARMKVSHH